MQALITLYPLFPLFPFCLQSSDQLWAESGSFQEGSGCLQYLGSWPHLLQMWEDAGSSGKRRENLAEGPKDFVWRDGTLHKVSAELWTINLILWRCHTTCLLPFLWGAQCDTLGGSHLFPTPAEAHENQFEMQPMPTTFANLREWCFDLKCVYFFICKEKCCPFFHGSLVGKKLFLKYTDAIVVSAGGISWNSFSTGGWNNLFG